MKRVLVSSCVLGAIVVMTASCDKLLHRDAPEAAASIEFAPPPVATATAAPDGGLAALATPDAGEDDEDDKQNPLAGLHVGDPPVTDAGACPRAIFPYYCRRNCRSWLSRMSSMHARRVYGSTRSGKGTCGGLNVFAEDGTNAEIVEYYDAKTNQLVGALDKKESGCNSYGTIPKCAPAITWTTHAPLTTGGGLGSITTPPDPFQGRK